jgi:hypothetical protein
MAPGYRQARAVAFESSSQELMKTSTHTIPERMRNPALDSVDDGPKGEEDDALENPQESGSDELPRPEAPGGGHGRLTSEQKVMEALIHTNTLPSIPLCRTVVELLQSRIAEGKVLAALNQLNRAKMRWAFKLLARQTKVSPPELAADSSDSDADEGAAWAYLDHPRHGL